MGLGPGSNNFAELMALKFLLTFAKEKGITSLQIFVDSQIVIIRASMILAFGHALTM
jgi:ribonuclease HI